MSLSDARRMYVLLRDAGPTGVHSHDLRSSGTTGQPSQRAKDIVSNGVALSTKRENRGKRPGSRYWLAEHAPSDAVAVRANRDVEVGGEPEQFSRRVAGDSQDERPAPVTDLNITPSPPDTHVPVATVRDFTDPEGCWREVPVSELDFDYEAAA